MVAAATVVARVECLVVEPKAVTAATVEWAADVAGTQEVREEHSVQKMEVDVVVLEVARLEAEAPLDVVAELETAEDLAVVNLVADVAELGLLAGVVRVLLKAVATEEAVLVVMKVVAGRSVVTEAVATEEAEVAISVEGAEEERKCVDHSQCNQHHRRRGCATRPHPHHHRCHLQRRNRKSACRSNTTEVAGLVAAMPVSVDRRALAAVVEAQVTLEAMEAEVEVAAVMAAEATVGAAMAGLMVGQLVAALRVAMVARWAAAVEWAVMVVCSAVAGEKGGSLVVLADMAKACAEEERQTWVRSPSSLYQEYNSLSLR